MNPYALSKYLFEKFANKFAIDFNVEVIGLRYSNVYGEGENHKGKRASMITQLLNKMINKIPPTIFKYGEQQRDWVYIQDVIEANMLASEAKCSGVFNVGSGETLTFNRIISIINDELNSNLEIEYIDCPYLGHYQDNTLCDLALSKEKLNYEPQKQTEVSLRSYIQKIKKTIV